MPFAPGDCILTGLCGLHTAYPGPPPGLLFLALGLVLGGVLGLWRARRAAQGPLSASAGRSTP